MNRSIELDVLKAVAIISVVLYHIGLLSPGFLGVDIFLVINGFFITKGLLKSFESESFKYSQWLLKRLIRLWPLVVLAGLVALCMGYLLMLPDDLENLGETVVASNLGSQNILASITTRNYWDASNDFKPLMHFWYVGILLQCYVIYPLFFIIIYRFAKNRDKVSMITIAGLSLISLFLCLLPFFGPFDKFYHLPFRLYEIGTGGVIAFCSLHQRKSCSDNAHYLGWIRWASYIALVIMLVFPTDALNNVLKSLVVCVLTGGGHFFIYDKRGCWFLSKSQTMEDSSCGWSR